jgi:hypothetical protein
MSPQTQVITEKFNLHGQFNSFSPRRFLRHCPQNLSDFSINSLFKKKKADANPTHLVPLESTWSQLQNGIKKPQICDAWKSG